MKVILMAAMTLCGRISPGTMGSSLDRKFLEKMRSETGASLLGAETLRQGDPEMRCLGGKLPDKRFRAIVSRSGDIPWQGKKMFAQGSRPIIFTSVELVGTLEKASAGRAHIHGLPADESGLLLAGIFEELGKRGAGSVLVEGGGRLNYSCLAQGLVDEIMVTVTPYLSGNHSAVSLADGPSSLGDPFLGLRLLSIQRLDSDELVLHYDIRKGKG